MTDMKLSKLLSEIIEQAKQIGERPNPPFTAERFFVTIIDRVNGRDQNKPTEGTGAELFILCEAFCDMVKDLPAAKQALMAYICQNKNTSFLDDLYMKKMTQEASQIASQMQENEVDALTLLACIVKEPTEAIKPWLDYAMIQKLATQTPQTPKAEPVKTKTQAEIEKEMSDLLGDVLVAEEDEVPQMPPKAVMAQMVTDVKRIRTYLRDHIFGQDHAINVFTTGYFQANMLSMLDSSRKRPRAVFLFAGPPGVGKTFMAESAAQALNMPFMRFDMSEYSDKEANLEFCGSDKVYKNGKPGNVTAFVAENPHSVLLFDEIEKAHINVIHLFLQMLDAGRLRDNYTDKEVDFSGTIIILTTNAGRQLYEECENGDLSGVSRKVIIKALRKDINPQTGAAYFPGALCSRFASGNVVMFNHISAQHLRQIAKNEIERHGRNLKKATGIRLVVDERVYTALLLSEGAAADARTIRARAETFFNDELYELLRLIASDKVVTGIEDIQQIRITVDLTQTPANIGGLFASADTTKVLVFAENAVVARCREKAPKITFIGTQNVSDAVEVIKNQSVNLVLLDMKRDHRGDDSGNLNIEDVDSAARDFFKFLKEQNNAQPVYLLEEKENALSEEEEITFLGQGVRGILRIRENDDFFAKRLEDIASNLHQQASMIKLAKENKLVSFETAQTITESGKYATIKLFDFQMAVAVDSEDAKNVLSAVSKPDVRFADVIGAGEAKKELAYFVEYLKNPKKYMGTGVKAPKGVLLYGPSGTGKTMLAKAMACEADVTFIAAEGNQFLKRYVGEGAEKVHELFKIARKYAPSILFVDEIDAIAKERRGGSGSGANGEETLTAFLTEMDGFVSDPSKPVFVLAATNFDAEPGSDKSLDSALMRRFDRRVYIDLPNKEDRICFLKMKIEKNPALDISEIQIDNLAVRSTGMSLAQLDSVIELALRSAIREGSTTVNDAILEEAFETFNSGEVKKWDASQLERVARHEAGHALMCWLSGQTPSYLTIVARGNHGGYMQHADQEGKAIYTKDELLARIRTSLGGRAAEIVYYGRQEGISTGAGGDLVSATRLAQQIVCTYGMDEEFGLAVVTGTMPDAVRTIVNRILKEQLEKAVKLILENRDKIDSLVGALMDKNHLNGVEIRQILEGNREEP